MPRARLIAKTECILPGIKTGGELIAYQARVSNPKGQEAQTEETSESLITSCLSRGHWSILESASMSIEVETTRAIAAQILRHSSFSFQEFSQRYAPVDLLVGEDLVATIVESFDPRLQDSSNRQSSIPIEKPFLHSILKGVASLPVILSCWTYRFLLKAGVAKEVARGILPMNTPTRIYITGNIRSFYFWLLVRNDMATQKEHREVAAACEEIFKREYPVVHACLLNHRIVKIAEGKAWKELRKAKKAGRAITGWRLEPIYADPPGVTTAIHADGCVSIKDGSRVLVLSQEQARNFAESYNNRLNQFN